jgi:hypothetical protein
VVQALWQLQQLRVTLCAATKHLLTECLFHCYADSFTLTLPLDLGQLQRLRVGHDSKGSLPRWHLVHLVVTMKDGSMAPPVTFPCGEV